MAGIVKRILGDEGGSVGLAYGSAGALVSFTVLVSLEAMGVPLEAVVSTLNGLIEFGLELVGLGV